MKKRKEGRLWREAANGKFSALIVYLTTGHYKWIYDKLSKKCTCYRHLDMM